MDEKIKIELERLLSLLKSKGKYLLTKYELILANLYKAYKSSEMSDTKILWIRKIEQMLNKSRTKIRKD
jgi:hypothetical protein|tara:strand:- start:121 stop:327 length:207 start_codon:yes stop_codon:yes gene_type:complete